MDRSVPYFVKNDKKTKTANQIVYDEFKELNKQTIDLERRSAIVPGSEILPDGVIEISKASPDGFEYQFSINDNPYF